MTIPRHPAPPARRDPAIECPHRPPCPGCPRLGERGISVQAAAQLQALAHGHGLPEVRVVSGAELGFRMRARLALRGRVGAPKVGIFAEQSHRIIHIPACRVQHPLINRVAEVVRRALIDTATPCYSDTAHAGLARYLQVVVERSSQRAQVVLVGNCSSAAPLAACLEAIRTGLGDELHSLWFNANTGTGNAILSPHFEHVAGPAAVIEHFGGAAIHYPPGAFGQSNLDLAERLIAELAPEIPPGARVVEYYGGVGAIGLSVLDRAGSLVINEASPASLEGLTLGCAALDPARAARVAAAPGGAADHAGLIADADIVIVDPPRKGLDAPLTAALVTTPPARLLYVSCGLEAFLRDVAALETGGRLRLTSLVAYNLLPYTEHVETVACFERA